MAAEYSTERIIQALRDTNGLVSLAARKLGCTTQTIYTRAKKVAAVQQTIDDSRAELVDHAELALRAAILDKQPWAVALVLKTLGRERGYVERQEVKTEISGPDNGAIPIRLVDYRVGIAETAE